MKYIVSLNFPIDTDNYPGIVTCEDVIELVHAMLRGEADLPEADDCNIEVA